MSSPVNMSDPTAVAAMMAEQAAQMAAVKSFNIEAFTLMVIGLMATSLRTYSRATTVGFSNFQADDYLVWVGTVRLLTPSLFFCFFFSFSFFLEPKPADDLRLWHGKSGGPLFRDWSGFLGW